MPFTRRQLFTRIAALLPVFKLAGSARETRPVEGAMAAVPEPPDDAFVRSLVDTLIPKDAFPGALDAGLDAWLLAEADSSPGIADNIAGIASTFIHAATLRGAARFETLSLDQREKFVSDILYPESGQPEPWALEARAPLHVIRRSLFSEFYLRPEGQQSLGYHQPWPRGYRSV